MSAGAANRASGGSSGADVARQDSPALQPAEREGKEVRRGPIGPSQNTKESSG